MMKELNKLQKEFIKFLANIQDNCVQTALCKNDNQSLKDKYYDITFETIIRTMELLDGYFNQYIGNLKITCEQSRENLKEKPYIELHDVVCDYLKGTDC